MPVIRPYIQSDKKFLLDIFKFNTPTYFDTSEISEFDGYLSKFPDTYLTIEKENKIIGGLGYIFSSDHTSGSITWIFIHPDYYRKGIGQNAFDHCLTILKTNPDLQKITVRTSQLVYHFFEKFDFKLVYTEKDYWAKGFDLYVMEMNV